MTEWPSYIDLQTGEKLLEKIKLNKQLYLTSKSGASYQIVKGIPRILKDFDNFMIFYYFEKEGI